MAQQGEDAGSRFCRGSAKFALFLTGEEEMLAELEKQRAEIVLDLNAMEIHGHFNAGDDVGAVKNAAVFLHVEKFDGKHVGGATQFLGGEKEGGGFALIFAPPVDNG